MADLLAEFKRLVAPLRNRVLSLVNRCRIEEHRETEEGKEGARLRRLVISILKDEINDNAEFLQQFGYISRPREGCEALVVHMGGNRSHAIVVSTDDPRYRPFNLQPGEVVIYNDGDRLAEDEEPPEFVEVPEDGSPVQGLCRIGLKPGREIEIACAKFTLTVNGVPSEVSAEGAEGGFLDSMARIDRDGIRILSGPCAGWYPIERGEDAS